MRLKSIDKMPTSDGQSLCTQKVLIGLGFHLSCTMEIQTKIRKNYQFSDDVAEAGTTVQRVLHLESHLTHPLSSHPQAAMSKTHPLPSPPQVAYS